MTAATDIRPPEIAAPAPPRPAARLDVTGLSVDYVSLTTASRLHALADVTFSAGAADVIAVVGPSGCGKSTLLRAIGGLIRPSAGTVRIDGRDGLTGDGARRRCGFVFQSDALFPWRTVNGNVAYGLDIEGRLSRHERRERVAALLSAVGLEGFGQCYPHELSGGMRQRVNLARALAIDPALLLLDEPFSSLDALTRDAMQIELLGVLKRSRKTSVFVTHQIDEAILMATRVLVFSARPGRIVEDIAIDLPTERDLATKSTQAFADYLAHIRARLHEMLPPAGGSTP